MSKRILLLPLVLFILSCDKTEDPGVEIPKTIDQTLIRTVWNTVSEKYEYKASDGTTVYQSSKVYEDFRNKSIQYNFRPNEATPDDHRVTRLDKFTNKLTSGAWNISREDKKDYVNITWDSGKLDKYEVTAFTEKTMSWSIVSTDNSDIQYKENGETKTAASRQGSIELHCPCRD
ncbi:MULTISPECIES: hypothetical protein [Olivibacter]|jgi:hypothetical protein|uniref:Lipocalin-like protein n=1 Tax=Olivibacter oleidegradans TaxID=760123 RepID=A0ABV6HGW7_9SPHI|nr:MULTISPECIES: hypothetical protein [Olivibacter]MDM8176763.1 hypothetical protein [Olivibacter sp. 47]QEL00579.1 hypothetical protein FKG96_07055 [Olivibacter sp. LS-1]